MQLLVLLLYTLLTDSLVQWDEGEHDGEFKVL